MKKTVYKLLVFVILGINFYLSNVMAQENTNYYFLGYIYSRLNNQELADSKVYPYTPVLLKYEDDLSKVLAVKIANGNGEVSFKGIPIDIYKDYIVEIFGVENSKPFSYLREGTKEPYSFPDGNLTIHMRLPHELNDFYAINEITFEKNEEDIPLIDLLKRYQNITFLEGSFFYSESKVPLKLFINGHGDYNDNQIRSMIHQISASVVKKVKIIKYTNPNPYYEGVIDIQLIQGDIADLSTTRKELLNWSLEIIEK